MLSFTSLMMAQSIFKGHKVCQGCGEALSSPIAKLTGECYKCSKKRLDGGEEDDGSIDNLFEE